MGINKKMIKPKKQNTQVLLYIHFMNRVAGLAATMRRRGADEKTALEAQKGFVNGIESTIENLSKGLISNSPGIGQNELQDILDVANNYNWTENATIVELYGIYSKITGAEKYM